MENNLGERSISFLKKPLFDWLLVALIMGCWCCALTYVDALIHRNNRSNPIRIYLSPMMVLLASSSFMLVLQKKNHGYLTNLQCVAFTGFFGLLTSYSEYFSRSSVTITVAVCLLSGILVFDKDLQSPALWLRDIKTRQPKLLSLLALVAFVYLIDWLYYPRLPHGRMQPPFMIDSIYYVAIAIGFYQGLIVSNKEFSQGLRFTLFIASIIYVGFVVFVDLLIDLKNNKDDSIPQSLELGIVFLTCIFPMGFALGNLITSDTSSSLENTPFDSPNKPLSKTYLLILVLASVALGLALTMFQSGFLDPLFRIELKKLGVNVSAVSCTAIGLSLCVVGALLTVPMGERITIWILGTLGAVGSISYLVQPQSINELPLAIQYGLLFLLPLTLTLLLLKKEFYWRVHRIVDKPRGMKQSNLTLHVCSTIALVACLYFVFIESGGDHSVDLRTVFAASSLSLVFCTLITPLTLIIAMVIPRPLTYCFFAIALSFFVSACSLSAFTLPSMARAPNELYVLLQIAFWPLQAITPPLLIASIVRLYGFKFSFGESSIATTTS